MSIPEFPQRSAPPEAPEEAREEAIDSATAPTTSDMANDPDTAQFPRDEPRTEKSANNDGEIADDDDLENSEKQAAKKILVVEDNELNLKLFCDLLDANGYDIAFTRNGREVMDLAHEFQPDLILMDIQLPEISGLDLTRCIKQDEALKDIPIIAVTAFAMKGDESKIREGGCEAYIAKPISVAHFIETVKRLAEADGPVDQAD